MSGTGLLISMKRATMLSGVNGTNLHIDGGAPMRLDGPIVLCGRFDNDTTRGYNGRITQLAIFNRALTPVQVYAIFQQARLYSASVPAEHMSHAHAIESDASLRLFIGTLAVGV